MHTLYVASAKGGAGKSTIATNLAAVGAQCGLRVHLADTDTQSPCSSLWCEWREEKHPELPSITASVVDHTQAGLLLEAARPNYDLTIIDGRPGHEESARTLSALVDCTLVVYQPSPLDLAVIERTIRAVLNTERVGLVANLCTRTNLSQAAYRGAARYADAFGLAACPHSTHNRVAFRRATARGVGVTEFEPVGAASKEVLSLWSWTTSLGEFRWLKQPSHEQRRVAFLS